MSIISELFINWWRDNCKSLPHHFYSGYWLAIYSSLSLIFRRYWVLLILPFFSSPKRGIQDVHVESNQGTHTLHLVSGAFDLKKFPSRSPKCYCYSWFQAQDDAMIQLDGSGTHIVTHGNEALRVDIRDSLLDCLSQF